MEGNLDVFRCGKGYIKMSLVKVVDLLGVELITENHCLLSRAVRGSDIRFEIQFRIGYSYPKIGIFDIRIRSEIFGSDIADIRYPFY